MSAARFLGELQFAEFLEQERAFVDYLISLPSLAIEIPITVAEQIADFVPTLQLRGNFCGLHRLKTPRAAQT